MIVYESYVPAHRIRASAATVARKLKRPTKHPALGAYLVARSAFSLGVTTLDAPSVFREAAQYGISVDHLINPSNVASKAFETLVERGWREHELESMRGSRFEALLKKEGLDRIGSDPVRRVHHADLFWSAVDNRPLVAVFVHDITRGSVQLRLVLDANAANFDMLQVSKDHIYEAWKRRNLDTLPPESLMPIYVDDLARSAVEREHSVRLLFNFAATVEHHEERKTIRLRDRSSFWLPSGKPLSDKEQIRGARRFLGLQQERMRCAAARYEKAHPGQAVSYTLELFHNATTQTRLLACDTSRLLTAWKYDPWRDLFTETVRVAA